mgnify:CR=1 FL=1
MKKNPCKNRPVHPLIRLVFLLAEETSPPTTNRMQEKIFAVFLQNSAGNTFFGASAFFLSGAVSIFLKNFRGYFVRPLDKANPGCYDKSNKIYRSLNQYREIGKIRIG